MRVSEQQFGQYQIDKVLGSGGFGVVYRAVNPALNKTVALKVLKPILMANPEFVARFKQEAQLAAQLQHSHLVQIFDFVEDAGRLGIVSDYLSGGDLQARMQEEPLTLDKTATVVEEVGRALDFMHEKTLIHRDVKPSNILFNAEDQAVLTDFGVTKALRGAALTADEAESAVHYTTTTGGAVGTPAYMAPEQIMGEEMDGRVDVYALGIVAYEMLTGTVPFTGPATKVHHGHVYEPPPALTEVVPAVPPAVSDVVLKALAKKPEERYATAGAFAQALVRAAAHVQSEWLPERLRELEGTADDHASLVTAIEQLEVLDRLFPNREDLLALLERLRAREHVDVLYDDVKQLWDRAKARAEEVVALVPNAPDPDHILERLLDERLRTGTVDSLATNDP
jgi:serine/threonine-protein kinase